MDSAVVYSEPALADLREITAYIARDNVEAAKRFANRLVDLAESLRRMPRKGRPVKGWTDVRVMVLSPYLIFYRFDVRENRVEVLRFWHGARDPRTFEIER
jgi:addiction module RelE/StbE family toxin